MHILILTLWLLLGAGPALAAEGALDILLTNDDGWDAPGLAALGAALGAAGHQVTVVAPLAQQSGTGVKITLGEIAVVEQSPRVWSVDGSPADAVSYGLHRILSDDPPDLVVSGANLGQNLGNNVVSSGTVGAAVMAVYNGVPAIAVSVGLDMAEANAKPERFPSTLAAYPGAAALVVKLIAVLRDANAGTQALLPPGVLLNVNYPARPAATIKGVRIAPLGRYGGFRLVYPEVAPGAKAISAMEADPRGHAEAETDTALFAAGYVTVGIIEPQWGSNTAVAAQLQPRLGELQSVLAK